VASAGSGDFSAPFVRFLACLGIKADICPPQRPDRNGFVERYNRTYKSETIFIYQPETFEQVIDMNLDEKQFYNFQRPNQARSCGNQPPRSAFPHLPALPSVPNLVDPDRWLETVDGTLYTRRVNASGSVQVDKFKYYIGRVYRGRSVVLQVDAANKQFKVELAEHPSNPSLSKDWNMVKCCSITIWNSFVNKLSQPGDCICVNNGGICPWLFEQ